MEHTTADESDVAVADLPSTSGAHWANRDAERRATPFRRPPAVNSFQDLTGTEAATPDGWDAFAPAGTAHDPDTARGSGATDIAWDACPAAGDATPRVRPDAPGAATTGPGRASFETLDPATTGSGRASFGVTDGPISGARPEPVSPAAPRTGSAEPVPTPGRSVPAPRTPVADRPIAGRGPATGELPSFADLRIDDDRPAGESAAGGIGDFINGPGREIRPHRVGDSPAHPAEHRRSRLVTAATVLLSTVVLLGGAVAGVAFFAGEDQSLTSVLRLGSGDSDGKVATAALNGRTTAGFELIAATTKVTVRTQDLGDDLFRITSAGDSGTAPSPVLSDDRVQLLLSPDGEGASGNVEVLLSAKVTWGLRFVGGTDEQIVDVTGGKVSSIDIAGGSRRVDLRLSQPTGTVPVRVTGAVDELSVLSPEGSPVRVKVDSGAKTVAAGDKTLRDVKPGSTLTPKDWKVPNRYDVDAASRVTLLTVRTGP